jgi:hypothetical protein
MLQENTQAGTIEHTETSEDEREDQDGKECVTHLQAHAALVDLGP